MDNEPLVSVIIPTRDRQDQVVRAVRSVFSQTYKNIECIVVDDASADNTQEALAEYGPEGLTVLRNDRPLNASGARNRGLRKASGGFVAFLDDDDQWLPTKIQRQMAVFESSEQDTLGLVYCWMNYYNREGLLLKRHAPALRGDVFKMVLDDQRIGSCSTLLVTKEAVDFVGGFDERLPRGNDGDLIRRICRAYSVDYVPEALVRYSHDGLGQRITHDTPQGIENALVSYFDRLDKFERDLRRLPRQRANIFAAIAFHYGRLGNGRACLKWYWKAFGTDPLSCTVYRRFARNIKETVRFKRGKYGLLGN